MNRSQARNPSTTYMTGALTTLVEGLATGRRKSTELAAAVGLVGLVAGAAVTAVTTGKSGSAPAGRRTRGRQPPEELHDQRFEYGVALPMACG